MCVMRGDVFIRTPVLQRIVDMRHSIKSLRNQSITEFSDVYTQYKLKF